MTKFYYHSSFWFKYWANKFGFYKTHKNSYKLSSEEYSSVDYYCKLKRKFLLTNGLCLSDIKLLRKTAYSYDLYNILATLPFEVKFYYIFGDNISNPSKPSLVKSRPVQGPNLNAVILPLECIRHFRFENDSKSFCRKNNLIVWRGAAYQKHRKKFLEKTFGEAFCNVGDTAKNAEKKQFIKPWMNISEQLKSKFIFSIEGNDVASNLKWIMSSNSICVMPKPKYETWFREGQLIPDVHYIEVSDDMSNLAEKYEYYLARPKLCKEIIDNANMYAMKFRDLQRQYAIARLVLKKYKNFSMYDC